jgi:hypothetical protein
VSSKIVCDECGEEARRNRLDVIRTSTRNTHSTQPGWLFVAFETENGRTADYHICSACWINKLEGFADKIRDEMLWEEG